MPRKPTKQPAMTSMDFSSLVDAIRVVNTHSAEVVNRVVNTSLTLRNWVIGAYISEYEMNGSDRAEYGDTLLPRLADRLKSMGLARMDDRELRRYRLFYRTYPTIRESLTPELSKLLQAGNIEHLISDPIRESVTPELGGAKKSLFGSLSFTHFAELITLDDPLKRAFYEIECLRGNWSVRALKRQIGSLYFERSGLSLDKEKLSAMANELVDTEEPRLSIRDPYILVLHDARRGQSTRRPPALHRQGSRPRRIRPFQYDQPPLRLQIPARTPQQGSPARVHRYQTQGGEW